MEVKILGGEENLVPPLLQQLCLQNITFSGRFDHDLTESEGITRFSWMGSSIKFPPATSLKVKLSSSPKRDSYWVLPQYDKLKATVSGSDHRLCTHPIPPRHRYIDLSQTDTVETFIFNPCGGILTLTLVSEIDLKDPGWVAYHGAEGEFVGQLAPKDSSRRKIQFIGDSDTAGYCAAGYPFKPWENLNIRAYADHSITWAAKLANLVNAEYQVQAISGIGVTEPVANFPMGAYVDKILPGIEFPDYDYTQFQPDAVIMLIGPNDNEEDPGFIYQYYHFLTHVAEKNPGGKLISVCAGSINGLACCDAVKKATSLFNKSDSNRAHVVGITQALWEDLNVYNGQGKFNGCNSHYNEKGHEAVAEGILDQVNKVMGWNSILNHEPQIRETHIAETPITETNL